MNRRTRWFPIGAAVLALSLAGCAPKTTDESPATTPDAAQTSQVPPDVPGAALTTAQSAGDFTVNLSVVGTPQEGENAFVATVTRDGQPVSDATVQVILSMPAMEMYGEELELEHTDAGQYEGTGNLTMAGDWQADVTITVGETEGKTVYDFRV